MSSSSEQPEYIEREAGMPCLSFLIFVSKNINCCCHFITLNFVFCVLLLEALGLQTWQPSPNPKASTSGDKKHFTLIIVLVMVGCFFVLIIGSSLLILRYISQANYLLNEEEVAEFFNEGQSLEPEVEAMALYVGLSMKYDRSYEQELSKFHIGE